MWFEVDMGSQQRFSSLSVDAGPSANDYPRGYQVFVSNDDQNWGDAIASGKGTSALVSIPFPTQSARYFKIVQTGSDPKWWWSIAELNALP
jgi:beta-glucosidase